MSVPPLLAQKLQSYDALRLVVRSLGHQRYSGLIERKYTSRFHGPAPYPTESLEFVGSGGGWGNKTLEDGERAIVFIRFLSGTNQYYQEHWHGHFSVIERLGCPLVVANWDLLSQGPGRSWGPEYLRAAAFPLSETELWRTAMPFALFEQHLLETIEQAFESPQ